MSIHVEKVVSHKDLTRFILFSREIYRRDPYWVQPLVKEMESRLDPAGNPFYDHSEIQAFLCVKDNKICGRIAAVLDNRYNETHREKAVFFGFFESVNDREVGAALMNAVAAWAGEKGASFIRGPVNPGSHDNWGLLVDGFDSSPVVRMPYNPQYYADLIENSGFTAEKDLLAYHLSVQAEIPRYLRDAVGAAASRRKIFLRTLDKDRVDEEIRLVMGIYNQAWHANWGFVALSDAEIGHLAEGLRPLIVDSLVVIAELDGKPAGFALALPDDNQVLKKLNGRQSPFGRTSPLSGREKITGVRLMTLGVLKKYRRLGIEAFLYLKIWEEARRLGYIDAECSWISEDNREMRNGLERIGAAVYKTYRLYRKNI